MSIGNFSNSLVTLSEAYALPREVHVDDDIEETSRELRKTPNVFFSHLFILFFSLYLFSFTMTFNTYTYGPIAGDSFLSLDFDISPKSTSSTPLIALVHGGAWRSEDKAEYNDFALGFTNLGFSVLLLSITCKQFFSSLPSQNNHIN